MKNLGTTNRFENRAKGSCREFADELFLHQRLSIVKCQPTSLFRKVKRIGHRCTQSHTDKCKPGKDRLCSCSTILFGIYSSLSVRLCVHLWLKLFRCLLFKIGILLADCGLPCRDFKFSIQTCRKDRRNRRSIPPSEFASHNDVIAMRKTPETHGNPQESGVEGWVMRDSNPRHPRCKHGALTS